MLATAGDWSQSKVQSVTTELLTTVPLTYSARRAVSVAVTSHLSVYRRYFRSAPLTLVGAEVILAPDSRCDLVWLLPNHAILIDEIKTGSPPGVFWMPDDQISRYLAAARKRWGRGFYGLRVCWLRAPGLSATLAVTGERIATGPSYRRNNAETPGGRVQ
jgi:hypothetical protein